MNEEPEIIINSELKEFLKSSYIEDFSWVAQQLSLSLQTIAFSELIEGGPQILFHTTLPISNRIINFGFIKQKNQLFVRFADISN